MEFWLGIGQREKKHSSLPQNGFYLFSKEKKKY